MPAVPDYCSGNFPVQDIFAATAAIASTAMVDAVREMFMHLSDLRDMEEKALSEDIDLLRALHDYRDKLKDASQRSGKRTKTSTTEN